MGKSKQRLSLFFKDNWVVTLFSTMFGVIAGIYLTGYFEERSLIVSKQNALEMVKQEIEQNRLALTAYDSTSRDSFEKTSYIFPKINEEKEILISKDSIEAFKAKSGGMISKLTFEPIIDDVNKVKVRGDLTLFINNKLVLLDLNSVIWQSYKQTNFLNVTSFECMTDIEELYLFQDNYNALNKKWSEEFTGGQFLASKDRLDNFMGLWENLLDMNTLLINTYKMTDETFKDCD